MARSPKAPLQRQERIRQARTAVQDALLATDQSLRRTCVSAIGPQCWRSEALYALGRFEDACAAAGACAQFAEGAAPNLIAHALLVRARSLAALGRQLESWDLLQASAEVRSSFKAILVRQDGRLPFVGLSFAC